MQVQIDESKCQGYLLCVNRVPEVFDEDDIGHGVAIEGEVPAEHEFEVREAIAECPMRAIFAKE